MRHLILTLFLLPLGQMFGQTPSKPYNVLFIAVDDLNDWVGCFGGNSQAITPNLDRLAKEQAIVMNKAYCASTVCCPSRSAILTGKRPSTTGIYGNTQDLKRAPKAKDVVTLPEYFAKNGYHTLSTGKIFHSIRRLRGWMRANGRSKSSLKAEDATKACCGKNLRHPPQAKKPTKRARRKVRKRK